MTNEKKKKMVKKSNGFNLCSFIPEPESWPALQLVGREKSSDWLSSAGGRGRDYKRQTQSAESHKHTHTLILKHIHVYV